MSKDIGAVLKAHTNFKVDRDFCKKILKYLDAYSNANDDRIEFLGSNLLGVRKFNMTNIELSEWLENIAGVEDAIALRNDIVSLEWMDDSRVISTDPINHSYLYIAHRLMVSKDISNDIKEKTLHATLLLLHYKFFTSMMTIFFPNPANEEIALAVYESLSRKSQIKVYGTWKALFDGRVDTLLKNSKFKNTITKYDSDEKIGKMLNAIHGGIKSLVRTLNDQFYTVIKNKAKIKAQSNIMVVNDEVRLRDKHNNFHRFKNNIHLTVVDRNSFVREDLIDTIDVVLGGIKKENLRKVLLYIHEKYIVRKTNGEMYELIDDILTYILTLSDSEKIPLTNIPDITLKMRNMIRSSGVKMNLLKSIKERIDVIIDDSLNIRSKNVISSTRLSVILYIGMRALLK